MDEALLITRQFWNDASPWSAETTGKPPQDEALRSTVWFRTSGSVGKPKWIVLKKSALLASAEAVNQHLCVDSRSCWGLALPIHHVGGFGVAARAYVAGCRFASCCSRWDAPQFTAWLAAHRVSHVSLVPAQVHDLVRARLQAPTGLRAVVVGGGALDAAHGRAARDLGWPVLASFGMTEAASQIATQTMDALECDDCQAPMALLPIWQCEIAASGCLRIAGPALFSGWLEASDDGMKFTPRVGEWHETSDRVALDAGGLTPLGRADLCVKILGELVDVASVERELTELLEDAASADEFTVVAVEDSRAGHALVPVFARGVDVQQVERALDAHRRMFPGFRRLNAPVWVDALPISELGKVRRGELVRIVAEAYPSIQ
jgi:O-succinylbenzoic acid--CoA ligase